MMPARSRQLILAILAAAGCCAAPSVAGAATELGPLSGPDGCLVAPGSKSTEGGTATCGVGKGLVGASAVAVSPDGKNVYVASGTSGATAASSWGSVAVLRRDTTSGAISEIGCLSSDGTDGRDGASGACTPTPSLLGADGIAVSPDGSNVFVTSGASGSVVAFARDSSTGALTRLGCFQFSPPRGSTCAPSNVFHSASAIVTSSDGKALFIAAPVEGAISTLAATAAEPPVAPDGVATETSLAGLFSAALPSVGLENPCVAVNGLDGTCSVGIATQGIDALTLSPDGKDLYAVAAKSEALDVFTPGSGGALTESGCLKVSAPPGLCTSSHLMAAPTQLAFSPDGTDVYVADDAETGGRVDVLTRDPASGALADGSCVENLPEPEQSEEGEEESEPDASEPAAPPSPCSAVPGLGTVEAVAVSGDGSAVYAIGDGSAAVFSRDRATGKLAEVSCASDEDKRCTSFPSLDGVEGAAVSPDGRDVYVAAGGSDAVAAFGVGASVTTARATATRARSASLRVACPARLRRPCAGSIALTRTLATQAPPKRRKRDPLRVTLGDSAHFRIAPGRSVAIPVRLSRSLIHLLETRRPVRLMAVLHADQFAGGSGYGREITLTLGSAESTRAGRPPK